jgi:hypothetical protein
MPKQNYKYDESVSLEKNSVLALYDIANELHDLTTFVAALGFADRVLPDGTIRETGAIQDLCTSIRDGFQILAERLDQQ